MQNSEQSQQRSSQNPNENANSVQIPLPIVEPLATYVLLGLIAVVFLAQIYVNQTYTPDDSLILKGGESLALVASGDYWRLFTAMFLHLNEAHIFFNGLALYSIGSNVERFFGHFRFVLIYFLGGLAGGITSLIFTPDPQILSVGASGAIFAIFGAEIAFLYANRGLFGESAQKQLRSLAILAAVNFGIGLFFYLAPGSIKIDIWAHAGGFAAGLALAWLIGPRLAVNPDAFAPSGYRVRDSITPRKIFEVSAATAVILAIAFGLRLALYHS